MYLQSDRPVQAIKWLHDHFDYVMFVNTMDATIGYEKINSMTRHDSEDSDRARLRVLEEENEELKRRLDELRSYMPAKQGNIHTLNLSELQNLTAGIEAVAGYSGPKACAAPLLPEIRITGDILMLQNKSEQTKLLMQLEREHVALKAVIENAPEGIVVVDEGGRITMTNPAADRLYAQPVPYKKSVHSHHLLKLCNPDGGAIAVEDLPLSRASFSGEVVMDTEMAIQWPDGQNRRLLVNAAPIRDGYGKICGAVGIFQDITRRSAEMDRLEHYRKDLEHLVAQRTAALESTIRALESKIYERELIERGLRRTQAELESLSRSALSALEADRKAVSKEIHDSVGASLAFIKFGLEEQISRLQQKQIPQSADLQEILNHLTDTIKEAKRIAAQLRPLTLDDLGVISTIQSFCRTTACIYGTAEIKADIEVAEKEIPDDYKIIIYRVMQEAVANAVRHGGSKNIRIHLVKGVEGLEFSVEDDGGGFDLQSIESGHDPLSGHGIESMRAMARICGGRVHINSGIGQGTHVSMMLPWRSPR